MPKKHKVNADVCLVELGLCTDLSHAKSLISCGLVFLGDTKILPGTQILNEQVDSIRIKNQKPYVSRGGVKLEAVFDKTGLNVQGFNCLDVGASTGGFTDLLLKKSAKQVFAVDVGTNLLDQKLYKDARVIPLENINAKNLDKSDSVTKVIAASSIDFCVMDVSFISVKNIIPSVPYFLKSGSYFCPMIKPQFELSKVQVPQGGVIENKADVTACLDDVSSFIKQHGFKVIDVIPAKITGAQGNQEYFIFSQKL